MTCEWYDYHWDPTAKLYGRFNPPYKQDRNILVQSGADIFQGQKLEDIKEMFEICKAHPQYRYLFLTRYPAVYMELGEKELLPRGDQYWYGSSINGPDDLFWWGNGYHSFIYMETVGNEFPPAEENTIKKVDWIIIAESRKLKMRERRKWIKGIVRDADKVGIPVFIEEPVKSVVGVRGMRKDFPWGKER